MPSFASQSIWVIELVDGVIKIRARNRQPLTDDDVVTVKLLLRRHFGSLSALRAKNLRRPDANEWAVTAVSSITHMLDPIVNFLVAYRRKRRMAVVDVAEAMMERPQRITGWEVGKSRPFMHNLRDWANGLGLDIIPVPMEIRDKVVREINAFLDLQYKDDLDYWDENPRAVRYYREEVNVHADLSPGSEFLGHSSNSGSKAPREPASGVLPDPRDPVWGQHQVHDAEPPERLDVEG